MGVVHISEMSGKMKYIDSINTNPLSNAFCEAMSKTDAVCSKCYSRNMLKSFRANCEKPFEKNSQVLSSSIIPIEDLPIVNILFFRFSSHGELLNETHFLNLINIAKKNKSTTFSLWTKRVNIVNNVLANIKKPKNLILICSDPKIDGDCELPENFDKIFRVTNDDNNPLVNCVGKCFDCRKCYTKNKITLIVERLKKSKIGKGGKEH